MSAKAMTSVWDKVTLPTATDGTESQPFCVPKGASSVAIHIPALVGAATTLKVQALQPQEDNDGTETWDDVSYASLLGALTFVALAGLTEETVITLPAWALGGGILRFVASAAQTGAADAIEVKLAWNIKG